MREDVASDASLSLTYVSDWDRTNTRNFNVWRRWRRHMDIAETRETEAIAEFVRRAKNRLAPQAHDNEH